MKSIKDNRRERMQLHSVKVLLCSCLICILPLAGCASNLTGDTYSRDEVRRTQTVRSGTITNIRTVNVEGTDSGVGTIGGAAVGGVIGSRIDGGHGAWALLGGIVGALAGGVAGTKAEEVVTRKNMLELTIREDSGRTVVVVQEPGNESFNVGDHVELLTTNQGVTRVRH